MKKLLFIALLTTIFIACSNPQEKRAAGLLESAEESLSRGNYRACMDSIVLLRSDCPKALEARQQALVLWQQAQLLLAQHEIAQSDSMIMVIDAQLADSTHLTLLQRNLLKYRRDSLKSRYDVNCAIVRKLKH